MKIVYSVKYNVDIGPHVFPTEKYGLVKDMLIKNNIASAEDFIEPEDAKEEEILLVHTKDYISKLLKGTLSGAEIARTELPYSKKLVQSSIRCVGGTISASRLALNQKIGIHIGGGFHHAYPGHGEGFCVLNDLAVAVKVLLKERLIKKALVIDCDLHQGNGTAAIFNGDASVFTFSIHQQNNYPFFKEKSSLDIGLRDGAKDGEYLEALKKSVPKILNQFRPDFIMYVAGADIYQFDILGALDITKGGIKARDEFILNEAKIRNIPIAITLAGGYAEKIDDTVEIHYNTVKSAVEILC